MPTQAQTKPCYRSDGSNETGKKIIKALLVAGGLNYYGRMGNRIGEYYYINKAGRIVYSKKVPKGYTLIAL